MDTARKALIDKLYFISFTAVLVLLPWWTRLSIYATIAMVILGLLSTSLQTKRQKLKQSPQVLIFLLLYSLYLVGMLYTANVSEGLKSIDQKLALIVFPILAASSISFTTHQRKFVAISFAYSNVLLTVVCIIINMIILSNGSHPQVNFDLNTLARFQSLHSDAHPAWMQISYSAFSYPFIAPTYLSIYLILSMLILAHQNILGGWRYLKYLIISWLVVVIVLLSSRMGIILLIGVGSLNLIFHLMDKKFPVRESLLSASFVISVCALVLIFPITRFRVVEEPLATPLTIPTDHTQWNSMNLRVLEWKSGLEGIKKYGLKGTGTGASLDVLYSRYHEYDMGGLNEKYNAHNQYIETYLEIGLPGFIAFVCCILYPLRFALAKKDTLMLSLVLMVAIACFTTSMFEKSRGLTFYMAFISLFIFTERKNDTRGKE